MQDFITWAHLCPVACRASEKKSTLGATFLPSSATASASIHQSHFTGSNFAVGGVQLPLVKPMGLPPGIPYLLVSMSYGQGVFPTPGYVPWGSVTEYNFDPMTGQPLRLTVPYSYPFISVIRHVPLCLLLPESHGFTPLMDEDDKETSPLVVGSSSHSPHMVMRGVVPTMTVPSSCAEMLLSTSPRANPRMSTSVASSTNQYVHRVVWQRPFTLANAALVNAEIG